MHSHSIFYEWDKAIQPLPRYGCRLLDSLSSPIHKGYCAMKPINPRFATALRMAKLIPLVQPEYKREAILALLGEIKKAIG